MAFENAPQSRLFLKLGSDQTALFQRSLVPGVERRRVSGGIVPLDHSRSPHRSIVPVRLIFFCSSNMPYSRASAVGGQPGT
jgi:hypothetical protein